MDHTASEGAPNRLTRGARVVIVLVAALGWFFGGVQIAITNVAMREASLDLLDREGRIDLVQQQALSGAAVRSESEQAQLDRWDALAGQWYAWFQCAFLFGAAAGGYLFGRLGDRLGRARALAISLLWFGVFTALGYGAQAAWQLLALRFLACLGVGGTWPNGVALVSEAFAERARPVMASLIGMSGNLGIFALGTLAAVFVVTPESWRWVLLVGASPAILGLLTWFLVEESPAWRARAAQETPASAGEVFRGNCRWATLLGIALATVPLMGGWGSANWMIPWAGEVGAASGDNALKAQVIQARALTSILGAGLAGTLACFLGRRTTYFLTSLGALLVAQYAFWYSSPAAGNFFWLVALLGFFNGVFFGWLPFYLPELFETRVRATGAGVSFNFGRILTATTIFVTGATMAHFGGYAEIGRVTSFVFALGMLVIMLAPDTSKRRMNT